MPPRILLRPAAITDCEQVLAWRNEPATRAMSIDQNVISLDQHRPWFERTLINPRRLLLIGTLPDAQQTGIGVCRFDIDDDGMSAEANINLAQAFHGQRLSVPLLAGCIAMFKERNPAIRLLHAKIRAENTASRRCFAECGFVEDAVGTGQAVITLQRPCGS